MEVYPVKASFIDFSILFSCEPITYKVFVKHL